MKRRRILAISIAIVTLLCLSHVGLLYNPSLAQAESLQLVDRNLLGASGYITMLRVHDVGTGFGPGSDFLDGEVVIRLDSYEGMSMGFQLRNDDLRPAREGMLNLLRDAFNNDWIVHVDFWLEPGKTNGEIIRVWLTKPMPLEM